MSADTCHHTYPANFVIYNTTSDPEAGRFWKWGRLSRSEPTPMTSSKNLSPYRLSKRRAAAKASKKARKQQRNARRRS